MFSVPRLGGTIVTLCVLLALATPASAATCLDTVVDAMGRDPVDKVAYEKAVHTWQLKTAQVFGVTFAQWSNSEESGRVCRQDGTLTYCQVFAKPCAVMSSLGGRVDEYTSFE